MNKFAIVMAIAAIAVFSGCVQGNYQANNAAPSANDGSGTAAKTAEIQIGNYAFSPAELQVTAGTIVKWTNADSVPHTVTSAAGNFNSGTIEPGQSFSFAFAAAPKSPTAFLMRSACVIHPPR